VVDAEQVTYDDLAQVVAATGHVSLTYRGVRVRADSVRVNLRDGRLEARGHVSIVDRDGREMRGEVITYDARAQVVELSSAEIIVNGVYIRSTSLRVQPGRITAGESTLTTCNPACPGYRITASHIEVIPNDRAVVTGATLWVGGTALFSLPVMVISLRSRKETAGSFPSVGYTSTDGLYAAYQFALDIGTPLFIISHSLGTLAQRAEAGVVLPPTPLGSLPLALEAAVSQGWHREFTRNVDTSRFQYMIGLQTPAIPLGPQTNMQLSWNWLDATYGTGARQQVVRAQSAITHQLGADTTLTLGYQALRLYGATPLALDAVNPRDIINELDLILKHTGLRGETVATTVTTGVSYDYLAMAASVFAAYGERIPRQYHWEVGPKYNLTTRETSVITDTGLALGTDVYVTVQAEYNTTTTVFKDLDYILTAPIADCFELSIKYRQMRQELTISLGVSPVPKGGAQLQSPPP
jgi:hypothetical protein